GVNPTRVDRDEHGLVTTTFDDGVHNMEVLDAVARSAADGGATVDLTATAGVHA
ncbi:hypothetical protein IAE22_30660, partial [Bacillus sp. S34]|nr:hypothetical protein [Bacillus sp. S34]